MAAIVSARTFDCLACCDTYNLGDKAGPGPFTCPVCGGVLRQRKDGVAAVDVYEPESYEDAASLAENIAQPVNLPLFALEAV